MNTLSKLLNNLRKRTPVGSIQMYAGLSEPEDWLLCDGRPVLRSDYPKLFSVIGTTYGAGDGSTTFNLPDMRDRVPVGAGNSYALNASGGSNSVSYTPAGTVGGTKLTDQQIAHGHGFTQPKLPNHTHSFTQPKLPNHSHGSSISNKRFVMSIWQTGRAGQVGIREASGASGTQFYTNASTVSPTDTDGAQTTGLPTTLPSCTGGAVGNPSSLPNCTGGSVANLHGTASSRTTHAHSFTGTGATINVRQPYRGINFIIYAGK